jgi:hypothetical protein
MSGHECPRLQGASGTNWARDKRPFDLALNRIDNPACKECQRASRSIASAWARPLNNHECHRRVGSLLPFGAAGDLGLALGCKGTA